MRNILLGITGGIAAYKSIFLCRELQRQGYRVRCVLTQAAETFVTAQTLQAITGEAPRRDLFDSTAEAAMGHIELARWADLLLIAPATANTIAKLSHGIADDLLSTLYLATTAEIVIAPAMNHQMWLHPATQANVATLRAREKHHVLSVGVGAQACGEIGPGRLLEPEEIVHDINALFPQDLRDKTLTITAGPTQEAIDPVRYLSNRSSGKMGYALAQAALDRGAKVNLITGPSALTPPAGCTVIAVTTAQEMYSQSLTYAPLSEIFIAAAAVSDYRIANPAAQKQKKTGSGTLTLELIENPDIIAAVAALDKPQRPFCVGFAAETEHLIAYASAKLTRKHLDLVVANDVSDNVFGSDSNQVVLLDKTGQTALPRQTKARLADAILTHILTRLKGRS